MIVSNKISTIFLQIILSILLIFGIGACQVKNESAKDTLPYYNSPDFTPLWFSTKKEAAKEITHTIADFNFKDQTGQIFSRSNLKGKIHVADFFFTACGSICPKMTTQLLQVQSTFKNDPMVLILSYSVTPWLDSVSRLRRFAERRKINASQWHLLTGNKSEIYKLARQSYFAEETTGYNKDSIEFLHTEHLILVDSDGRIRGLYNGTLALETERLIHDIKVLELEP